MGEEAHEDEAVEAERSLVVEIELESELSEGTRDAQAKLTADGD